MAGTGCLDKLEKQPALLGCTEPLGEGILKHSRLRAALPVSRRCCKRSKDTGFKAEERVLQAAAAHPEKTSSRQEKRTEGLKTIPVSRVTLCHAKQPWGKPHPSSLRGECAGPAGPPVLTPCSPSKAGQGARRLPKGQCPPALLTGEDGVCGVEAVVLQEQPLLSPPLTKNKPHGVSNPHPVDRGQGMGGKHSDSNPLRLVGWPRGP